VKKKVILDEVYSFHWGYKDVDDSLI